MYDCDILGAMGANRFKNEKLYHSFRRYKPQEGKIIFYREGQEHIILFEYNFKDAIPISFHVDFDNQNSMIVTVIISAAMIDLRFFPNKTKWNEKSPTRYIDYGWAESCTPLKEVIANRAKENKQPKILDSYFKDKKGKIKKLTHGKEVNLVLKTKNMINDFVNIDLSKYKVNFEYKGNILPKGKLENILILNNDFEIKLKTIKK